MNKKEKILIHPMDDWLAGIYIKPFGGAKTTPLAYEISESHRHDFYYCVLVDKGNLKLEVDFEPVTLTNQALFLSYPGQIHRIISAQLERGWFLAFNPTLLDDSLKNILDQCLSEIILVHLSPEQSSSFLSSITHVYKIYTNQPQLFHQMIIQSLVTALVYQLVSAYLSAEKSQLTRHPTRSVEITKTFKRLLRLQIKSLRRPSQFAAQMNMTVSHLNDTIRSVTGFSVTYSIQQELMREAKRILYSSDLSIKEIADSLGFDDPTYFNRLFSKVVGMSPGAFRKQAEQNTHV